MEEKIRQAIRHVQCNGGDGEVVVILRPERDPVVKTTTAERVTA